MTDDPSAARGQPAWRPRLSLFSALLLMTITGIGINLWLVHREIEPLREEVRQLRTETGHLTINDPSRLYAIAVWTPDRWRWRWRVRIPEEGRYYLHTMAIGVPKEGFEPQDDLALGDGVGIPAGEHLLEFRLTEGKLNGTARSYELKGRLFSPQRSYGEVYNISERLQRWGVHNGVSLWSSFKYDSLSGPQVSLAPNEPLELLRVRAYDIEVVKRNKAGKPNYWNTQESEGPSDGLLLWISNNKRGKSE